MPLACSSIQVGYSIDNDGCLWTFTYTIMGSIRYSEEQHPFLINGARHLPHIIKTLTYITSISCGFVHLLLLDEKGNVWTRGESNHGALGLGNNTLSTNGDVLRVDTLNEIKSISCSNNASFCIGNNNDVFAFGVNEWNQLTLKCGDQVFEPTKLDVVFETKKIVGGIVHTLFLTTSGEVYYFGKKMDTISTKIEKGGISLKLNLPEVVDIACGSSHSILLTSDNELYSFGSNTEGQLGLSESSNSKYTPQKVSLPDSVEYPIRSIYCGFVSSTFIDASNSVWFCGTSYGQCNSREIMGNSLKFFTKINIEEAVYASQGGNHVIVRCLNGIWSFGVQTNGSSPVTNYQKYPPQPIEEKFHSMMTLAFVSHSRVKSARK